VLQTTWIDIRSGEYDPKDDRYCFIGYPSIWANPFRNRRGWTWAQKVNAYGDLLLARPDLLRRLPDVKGKVLVCYCGSAHPCHAEPIAHLADSGWWEAV
jgi:hypothetical protein